MSVKTLSRRKLVAACAAAGLLITASACGDDGSGSNGGGSGDPGTVEWWHIQTDTALTPVWSEFIEEFEAANEGASVNETPTENEAFKSRLTTAMQAGSPPDLFQSWGGGVLRQQVDAGLVMDITDELSDVIEQLSPGALQPYTIEGRVYGLPWDMGMTGFWYNRALFEQAGITEEPTTWSDFLDVIEQLKAADITPIALAGADLWPGHFYYGWLLTRVAGLDALVEASQNQSFTENPDFVRAGQLLEELVELEPFQEGFLGATYGDPDGQAALVGNGEAAMELMGQWAPTVQADASGTDGLGDDLGFFVFPEVEGGNGTLTEVFGGGNGFSIGANAPDETVDFLRYMFENSDRIYEADGGLVSTRADAPPPDQAAQATMQEAIQNATGFQLYLDQDLPPAVGSEVNQAVGALIAGQSSPEQVVQSITDVFQREPGL